MRQNFLRKCFIVLLCQSLTYTPLLRAEQLSLPSGDLVAPKITQEQYVDKVAQGVNHDIKVTVTDNVGVNQVTLYYRSIGTENYKRMTMDNIIDTDDYHATVNADQIQPPGLEYYVQAMDNAGNTLLHGYSFSPLSVKTISSDTAVASSSSTAYFEAEESSNTWLWVGLGVLAVGLAVAAGGSGGGDDGGTSGSNGTATLTINASNPNQ